MPFWFGQENEIFLYRLIPMYRFRIVDIYNGVCSQVWFGCGHFSIWVKCTTIIVWFKSHACGGFEQLGCGSMQFQASNWVLVRLCPVTNTTTETKAINTAPKAF